MEVVIAVFICLSSLDVPIPLANQSTRAAYIAGTSSGPTHLEYLLGIFNMRGSNPETVSQGRSALSMDGGITALSGGTIRRKEHYGAPSRLYGGEGPTMTMINW